jgi:hypothetical protein
VKRFKFDGSVSVKVQKEWQHDVNVLKAIRSDRVVRMIAVCENPYCIVMELMEGSRRCTGTNYNLVSLKAQSLFLLSPRTHRFSLQLDRILHGGTCLVNETSTND